MRHWPGSRPRADLVSAEHTCTTREAPAAAPSRCSLWCSVCGESAPALVDRARFGAFRMRCQVVPTRAPDSIAQQPRAWRITRYDFAQFHEAGSQASVYLMAGSGARNWSMAACLQTPGRANGARGQRRQSTARAFSSSQIGSVFSTFSSGQIGSVFSTFSHLLDQRLDDDGDAQHR